MEFNKSYLILQSLKAQNLSNKRISELTGLNQSSISRVLNNKQKSISQKNETKLFKTIKQKAVYNKNSKTHSNNYSDVVLVRAAGAISNYLGSTNSYYNVSRRVGKLKKSKAVLKEVVKGYKKYKASEDQEEEILQYLTSDILKEGLIEITG